MANYVVEKYETIIKIMKTKVQLENFNGEQFVYLDSPLKPASAFLCSSGHPKYIPAVHFRIFCRQDRHPYQ